MGAAQSDTNTGGNTSANGTLNNTNTNALVNNTNLSNEVLRYGGFEEECTCVIGGYLTNAFSTIENYNNINNHCNGILLINQYSIENYNPVSGDRRLKHKQYYINDHVNNKHKYIHDTITTSCFSHNICNIYETPIVAVGTINGIVCIYNVSDANISICKKYLDLSVPDDEEETSEVCEQKEEDIESLEEDFKATHDDDNVVSSISKVISCTANSISMLEENAYKDVEIELKDIEAPSKSKEIEFGGDVENGTQGSASVCEKPDPVKRPVTHEGSSSLMECEEDSVADSEEEMRKSNSDVESQSRPQPPPPPLNDVRITHISIPMPNALLIGDSIGRLHCYNLTTSDAWCLIDLSSLLAWNSIEYHPKKLSIIGMLLLPVVQSADEISDCVHYLLVSMTSDGLVTVHSLPTVVENQMLHHMLTNSTEMVPTSEKGRFPSSNAEVELEFNEHASSILSSNSELVMAYVTEKQPILLSHMSFEGSAGYLISVHSYTHCVWCVPVATIVSQNSDGNPDDGPMVIDFKEQLLPYGDVSATTKAACFYDDQCILFTGLSNGVVYVWRIVVVDSEAVLILLKRAAPTKISNINTPITSLCYQPEYDTLTVGDNDGVLKLIVGVLSETAQPGMTSQVVATDNMHNSVNSPSTANKSTTPASPVDVSATTSISSKNFETPPSHVFSIELDDDEDCGDSPDRNDSKMVLTEGETHVLEDEKMHMNSNLAAELHDAGTSDIVGWNDEVVNEDVVEKLNSNACGSANVSISVLKDDKIGDTVNTIAKDLDIVTSNTSLAVQEVVDTESVDVSASAWV